MSKGLGSFPWATLGRNMPKTHWSISILSRIDRPIVSSDPLKLPYVGVYKVTKKRNERVVVTLGGRRILLVRDVKQGKRIYDIYTTILKRKKLIPMWTMTNWELLGEDIPVEIFDLWWQCKATRWFINNLTLPTTYQGIRYNPYRKGARWLATYVKPCGMLHYIGFFFHADTAAKVRDNRIRTLKLNKLGKIKRMNFRMQQDHLTILESNSLTMPFIGVYKLPGMKYAARQYWDVVNVKCNLGIYSTRINAAKAYDKRVLELWANKKDRSFPYPATNFPPTHYNYQLQEPPSKPIRKLKDLLKPLFNYKDVTPPIKNQAWVI